MAQDFSFDVVSKVDMQEVRNAIDQTMREVGTRFDFKNSISDVSQEGNVLKLVSDNDFKLKALIQVLQEKLARREVPLNALDFGKVEPAARDTVRQEITLKQGIETDKGKQIARLIKDSGLKAQTQLQGDQVRVSSKSKDILQQVMTLLKKEDLGITLQFTNYR